MEHTHDEQGIWDSCDVALEEIRNIISVHVSPILTLRLIRLVLDNLETEVELWDGCI